MTPGIHHVTAVAGSARRTVDFYTGVLGLRLVKKTVNFDDPGAYHLYFGDREGTPGTILTFFVWPGLPSGRSGAGKVLTVAWRAPEGSLGEWRRRLQRLGVPAAPGRFGAEAISLQDPDGMELELVATADAAPRTPWPGSTVDPDMTLRGFHGIRMAVGSPGPSLRFLEQTMGMRVVGEETSGMRLASAAQPPGAASFVVLEERPGGSAGFVGTGSVHHVAWRTTDEESQLRWRRRLLEAGRPVTEVIDRIYFRSIYFREPGGVLFEIATDSPGFAADEPVEALGSSLKLPPWLESERPQIEAALPAF